MKRIAILLAVMLALALTSGTVATKSVALNQQQAITGGIANAVTLASGLIVQTSATTGAGTVNVSGQKGSMTKSGATKMDVVLFARNMKDASLLAASPAEINTQANLTNSKNNSISREGAANSGTCNVHFAVLTINAQATTSDQFVI
jgi:hypothetical protein